MPETVKLLPRLKHLQPEQYESWLRKATDPEWDEERFGCSTRSKPERAAAALALELRDALAVNQRLLEALKDCSELLNVAMERLGICGEGDDGDRRADAEFPGGIAALHMARATIKEAGEANG